MNTTIISVIGSAVITLHLAMCVYEYKKDVKRWWDGESPKDKRKKRREMDKEKSNHIRALLVERHNLESSTFEGMEEQA